MAQCSRSVPDWMSFRRLRWSTFGRSRPQVDRFRAELVELSCEFSPRHPDGGPKFAPVGRDLGRIRRVGANSTDTSRVRSRSGRIRPEFGRCLPDASQLAGESTKMSDKARPMVANIGRRRQAERSPCTPEWQRTFAYSGFRLAPFDGSSSLVRLSLSEVLGGRLRFVSTWVAQGWGGYGPKSEGCPKAWPRLTSWRSGLDEDRCRHCLMRRMQANPCPESRQNESSARPSPARMLGDRLLWRAVAPQSQAATVIAEPFRSTSPPRLSPTRSVASSRCHAMSVEVAQRQSTSSDTAQYS